VDFGMTVSKCSVRMVWALCVFPLSWSQKNCAHDLLTRVIASMERNGLSSREMGSVPEEENRRKLSA
jgi:hypothetical protein